MKNGAQRAPSCLMYSAGLAAAVAAVVAATVVVAAAVVAAAATAAAGEENDKDNYYPKAAISISAEHILTLSPHIEILVRFDAALCG